LLPLSLDADQGEILCSIYPEGDIGSVKADGSEMTILMDTPASLDIYDNRHAAWLPDGNRFSYTLDDFIQAEIWVANVQGSKAQFLLGDVAADSSHSWSPDGQSIAYVATSNQIILYNLATQTSFQLTEEPFRLASAPDWSPDGSRIAFSAIEGSNQDIYLIDIAGTNLVRVTISAEADQSPAWSPDSTKIVFSSTRDGDQIKDLFVIDLSQGTEAEGNIPKQLTFADTLDIDPDWSPDGQYIVYAAHTLGAGHATLFIMDVNGERRFQLTKENTYHSPRWRP
jgi:TolB protein